MQTFLDILVVLTQYDEASRAVFRPHLTALHAAVAQILHPMCNPVYLFPMDDNDQGVIENVNDVLQSLGDPFSGVCFVSMVRIWLLISEHRDRKLRAQREREERRPPPRAPPKPFVEVNGWLPQSHDEDEDIDDDDDEEEEGEKFGDGADSADGGSGGADEDLNVDDAMMTILEYVTRASKVANEAELVAASAVLGKEAMRRLYETLEAGSEEDPDIGDSCAKLAAAMKALEAEAKVAKENEKEAEIDKEPETAMTTTTKNAEQVAEASIEA